MNKLKECPWYLKVLGFNYRYAMRVLTNPKLEKDSWGYKVKIEYKILYWFNFRIKQYKPYCKTRVV